MKQAEQAWNDVFWPGFKLEVHRLMVWAGVSPDTRLAAFDASSMTELKAAITLAADELRDRR